VQAQMENMRIDERRGIWLRIGRPQSKMGEHSKRTLMSTTGEPTLIYAT
jgi:hypothetical protein